MAYTVLARRYRSTTFDEVVGQDHVTVTLKKAIQTNRIAHAYLFCGTRGTGKTSVARIFAKALNCQQSDAPTPTPCGKCQNCQAIAAGVDLDVIEIDAASNTQVEHTREVILEHAQYLPAHSRYKVFIIDEAHMLSKASFNALLKTLEEPPEHVVFILATTEPEKLLPTILSRCQRYDFRNIPTRAIAKHLSAVCRAEQIDADDEALFLVARSGAGSIRDALSLLDRLISVGDRSLTVETVEQTLGLPRAQVMFDLAQAIGSGDIAGLLQQVDRQLAGGLSADTVVGSLIEHFRNLLLLRACGPNCELVEVPGMSPTELSKQAERFELATLSQDISILEELRRQVRGSVAARALVDATFVRLALADQFASIDELLSRLADDSSSTDEKKKPPELTAPAETTPAPLLSASPLTTLPMTASAAPTSASPVSPSPTSAPPTSPLPTSASTVSLVAEAGSFVEEDDDELPAVGKVWKQDTGPSLAEMLRRHEQSVASAGHVAPVGHVASAGHVAPAGHVEPVGHVAPVENPAMPAMTSARPSHDATSGDSRTEEVWRRVLDEIATNAPGFYPFLQDATLRQIDSDVATILLKHEHGHSRSFLERGKHEHIAGVLSRLLARPVRVQLQFAEPEPGSAPAPAEAKVARRPRPEPRLRPTVPIPEPVRETRLTPEAKAEAEADPLVRAAITELGAIVVRVETT